MNAGEDQSGCISDRFVVGTGDIDDKGALRRAAFAIGDAVVNGDGLRVVSSEGLLGGIGWIESPGAIGVDGQAWGFSAKEAVGEGITVGIVG